MPDTFTTRNRFEKMEPGQYADTWASRANGQFGSDLMDAALDGMVAFTLSGSKTLTNNNGTSDEARCRILNITGGTGGTITIPNVEKCYLVRNNTSGNVVFTTGSGTTATLASGARDWVFCDGSNAVYSALVGDFGSQNVTTSGSILSTGGLIGYNTGAGGAVTQSTSKSTGVTINEPCGRITMNNAALAANTSVSFLVTNSHCTPNSVIAFSLAAVPANSYVGQADAGTGQFGFLLWNKSGGSLSDAVVINFALINSVTS